MLLSDRALATSYRLSIVVIMSPPAAVWPQFSLKSFKKLINNRISETVRNRAIN